MGFASGSVSFRRFLVVGEHPKEITQQILDKLAEFALQIGEYSVPDEVEYGWCGGRHVFDGNFSFEHNVFNEALNFALRIDTNRVPGELKKAYQVMEEEAAAANNPSGHISKKQKKDVKDIVRQKVEEDLKSGKFRRSKLVPILWDFPTRTLYTPGSNSAMEKLYELFERTFGLNLEPLSAGTVAQRHLEDVKKRREYEDARPTRFAAGPEGESQMPEYPWTAQGPQPKDFLGNEFLLWLWHHIETQGGTIKTEQVGDVAVVLDRSLELDCAYGQTGKDALRGDGPTRMPEARDGLRSGKMPRKAGLIIETAGKQYQLTFNCETLGCGSTVLPDVEEAEDARVLFEERIFMLRDLSKGLDALLYNFLKTRASSAWEGQVNTIRRWIMQSSKQAAA
ncbi:MAG TPA: hypothetical protein VHP11_12420 [Tepidisphaeraceae bacterium]|nr:hypothetical protein [Tepidisphaeraceae bacterium]